MGQQELHTKGQHISQLSFLATGLYDKPGSSLRRIDVKVYGPHLFAE